MIKSRFQYYHLANDVLIGNLIANILGDQITGLFFSNRMIHASEGFISLVEIVDIFYGLIVSMAGILIIVQYERPIRKCLKEMYMGREPAPALLEKAQKRLLNEPYWIVVINIFVWGAGSVLFWLMGTGTPYIGIACGMVTVILAFFWVEHVSQKRLIPLFFPDGGLSKVKGTKTVSIRIRVGALLMAVSIVPLTYLYLTTRWFKHLQVTSDLDPGELLDQLQETLLMESFLFIVLAVGLSFLVGTNLREPLQEIIRVMRHVIRGDFSKKAKVTTNDELGFAGETLNAMTSGLQDREFIKDTFGRYLDRRVRDEILKGNIPLDGELKEATILFADLRNFTPLAATLPPKELIHILNDYLDEMAKSIEENQGLILQFIGDEIEAVFGAPVYHSAHETSAVKSAIDMRRRLDDLNQSHAAQGLPQLKHGIGIHTGQVLAANIGSRERTAYSMVGDTVNMASRIQELNKQFKTDILISDAVARYVKDDFSLLPMEKTLVKGIDSPVSVYSVVR